MNTRLLFLEGPIQTGKSTLLRTGLRRYLGDAPEGCGGFASQRLLDSCEKILGFRIGPAGQTPLNARVTDRERTAILQDLERPAGSQKTGLLSQDRLSNIFKFSGADGKIITRQDVFDTAGAQLLAMCSLEHRLILLDEIGGSELLSLPFREALADVLSASAAGDLPPCIGVIKQTRNAQRLQRQYPARGAFPSDLAELNISLRRRILALGGQILFYQRPDPSVEEQVMDFIRSAISSHHASDPVRSGSSF